MLDTIFSERSGKIFGSFGLLALAVCLALVAYSAITGDISDASDAECSAALLKATSSEAGKDGPLRILSVVPTHTTVDRRLCVVVAGVTPKADEKPDLQPVELELFMNDVAAEHLAVKADPVAAPQILTFRLDAPSDATSEGARFWRALLAGGGGSNVSELKFGERSLTVGLSRSGASAPVTRSNPIALVIYDVWVFWIGVAAFLLLLLSFCGFARNSTLLRDNSRTEMDNLTDAAAKAQAAYREILDVADADRKALEKAQTALQAAKAAAAAAPADAAAQKALEDQGTAVEAATTTLNHTKDLLAEREAARSKADQDLAAMTTPINSGKANRPAGPYSLGRTQMAFWLLLTIAGFIFIWLSIGQYYNLITAGILVLLGITGVAGLASIQLNDPKDAESRTSSFLADILNDGDGPKLHRIQAVAWTVILGVIFAWNVFWNFQFVEFDTNLLLLIGIAQSLYLGFKVQEKPAG